jgi:transcription-repair coupling factor (superfamily II helicase)
MSISRESLSKLLSLTPEQTYRKLTNLKGASRAFVVSLLKEHCLVICQNDESARQFFADLLFWTQVFQLKPPLMLPPKGESERFKAIKQLADNEKVIASVEAALSKTWAPNQIPSFELSKGMDTGRDFLVEILKDEGYRLVSLVADAGEMSMRGGIVDLFPPDREFPIRVEFFGDEIESIRIFDIDTQRTIEHVHKVSVGPAKEPVQGENLLTIMKESVVVINEPHDIAKHCPEFPCLDNKKIELSSMSLYGDEYAHLFSSLHSYGIIREERKGIDEIPEKIMHLLQEYRIFLVCYSHGQARRLMDLFKDADMYVPFVKTEEMLSHKSSVTMTVGELSTGFIFNNFIFITARDLFGEKPAYRPHKKSRIAGLLSSIEDLKEGDYIVHLDHGVGQFMGITKQGTEGAEKEVMVLEYSGGDRLYVPLDRIDRIQKYRAGEGVLPRLNKLGTKTWLKTRQRVKKKIKDMAEKLIKTHARRFNYKGTAFFQDSELHREFEGFFPYEETPDQITAIEEIKADMEKPEPMDRLLCGDVGYGKTEVAMRAAFKVVHDSKQVAVLVPTTVLAEQHYDTFSARFSAFPVTVDYLSRFKSSSEQRKTVEALNKGDIDIIIGTHRLFAKDVSFFDLGLLIIDEEQKFGVTHKEKIKMLKPGVDILTLSATPIPRTLHMAISGIRNISTIETPPEDRLSVRTFVSSYEKEIVKEAIERELHRGGQVFYVHNRVQSIYRVANVIQELIPEAKVNVAHGQLAEQELERVMLSFMRREFNVLVSTSIISSGLDIPSANTIIVDRADRFGLADLYQLRGRVGRSSLRAYAYFFIPGEDVITEVARKRLEALQELSYLGAGFRLAMKDMEIRGAGNLLGSEQSGRIEEVGYDMYIDMLQKAVAEIKGEDTGDDEDTVIDLRVQAAISEHYIDDPGIRLNLYRRIATAKDNETLSGIEEELRDRFGRHPEETRMLFKIMELKIAARKAQIAEIKKTGSEIRLFFKKSTNIEPDKVISAAAKRQNYARLLPEGGIAIKNSTKSFYEVLAILQEMLEELT